MVLRWKVRDGLLAYVARLQAEAMIDYRLQRLEYVILAAAGAGKKLKPPRPPAILME